MTTYLPILEQSTYLLKNLPSRKRWPPTYICRRRWPLLPTHRGGDGYLCTPYIGGDGHHYSKQFILIMDGRWQPSSIYLGGDGHLSSFFGAVYLIIYLPNYLRGDGHPPIWRRWPPLPNYVRRGWPPIYLSSSSLPTYLHTYLSRKRWPPTYISGRK